MKAIIASDLHGNIEYIKKLDEFISLENPDYLILLGDLLGYNQEISSSILNKYHSIIYAVKGNNDSISCQNYLQFNCLQEYSRIKIDNISFFLTHGHLLYKYIDKVKDDYILSGHTHIYNIYGRNINPGSVGYPRYSKEHTCLLLNNQVIYLINLENFSPIDSCKLSPNKDNQ